MTAIESHEFVEECLALAEKATSGPWDHGGSTGHDDSQWVWERTAHATGDPDAPDTRVCCASPADAAFIAHARDGIPRLARSHKALHEENQVYLQSLAAANGTATSVIRERDGLRTALAEANAKLAAVEARDERCLRLLGAHEYVADGHASQWAETLEECCKRLHDEGTANGDVAAMLYETEVKLAASENANRRLRDALVAARQAVLLGVDTQEQSNSIVRVVDAALAPAAKEGKP